MLAHRQGVWAKFLVHSIHFSSALASRFFAPLAAAFEHSSHQHICHSLSDFDFLCLGVSRCLSHAKSGHEFLQSHNANSSLNVETSHFFKSLSSKRRLSNLTSVHTLLGRVFSAQIDDAFAQMDCLDDYDVYAGDGHYHEAACFDSKVTSSSGKEGKPAVGHFFLMNLRNHFLSHLDVHYLKEMKKREHDMAVLKRIGPEELRQGAQTGRKVLYAWDKASVDYPFWSKCKQRGVYFITREKDNSALETVGINPIPADDKRFEGVLSDQLVGGSNSELLRRIVYQDGRDGKEYTFITSNRELPAWALVLVYQKRWDIEKCFDELKNKMSERKSWGSSRETKVAHALFECLAHNLCLLMEKEMEEEGLRDKVEERKKRGRKATVRNRVGEKMKEGKTFLHKVISRASQRSVRFIRWIRCWMYQEASWAKVRANLSKVWGCSIK